ncbi:MAG: membrane dipeptidase [Planctomycetota bacterium]
MISAQPIFDAHLDLAYLAEVGRDLTQSLASLDASADPHPPAAVTLPELAQANVRRCLGTIFTEASADPAGRFAPISYPPGDATAAYFKGIAQLNRYHTWARDGHIEFFGAASNEPAPVQIGVLVECADPIISPHDLSFWAARGVVAIGLTWVHQSRYAGGNATDAGLTDLGRELIREMARLDIALDLSHLSQRSTMDALDFADVRVCATHSNCRSLLGDRNNSGWQRHIDDDSIATVAARGGVIGLNLYRAFIKLGLNGTDRPSIADAVDHIDHVCQIAGSARHAGIGSDFDGGFSADELPKGIDRAGDLHKVLDELSHRNYSDADIADIAFNNWSRFFSLDATPAAAQ